MDTLVVPDIAAYGAEKGALEKWYQDSISELQVELNDDPPSLEDAYNKLDTTYHTKVAELNVKYGVEEAVLTEEQADLFYETVDELHEDSEEFSCIMEKIDPKRKEAYKRERKAALHRLNNEFGRIRTKWKREMKDRAGWYDREIAKYDYKKTDKGEDGYESSYKILRREQKEMTDHIREKRDAELKVHKKRRNKILKSIRGKYSLKEGYKEDSRVTEGFLDDWWRQIQSIFSSNMREIVSKTEHQLDNPHKIKRDIQVLDRQLEKKARDRDFIDMQEGFLSTLSTMPLNPFKIPGWFWNDIYMKWLDSRIGWIRDRSWEQRVRKADPTANPDTYVFHQGTRSEMTKDDYTAWFYALMTINFLGTLVLLGKIPIIGSLVKYLYTEAVSVIMTMWEKVVAIL
jgi:hypothetical protein